MSAKSRKESLEKSGLRDLAHRIEKLTEVGIALSSERDTERLLEQILLGAKAITNADGGALYSVQDDRTVRMEIIRTDSLNFAMGGTTGEHIPFPAIPLYAADGAPNHHNVVTQAVLNDRTINIPDAYCAEGFDFTGTREFDKQTGYRSTSFLTVPMKNHEGDIIGVLQLLNAQDESSGEIIPFSPESQRLAEALASQAAITLTNRRLIDDMKNLFESLIQLIANAIDEKSPYTGGHCRRVPVITMLLAEAAHLTTEGPLKDFSLTDQGRYELEIAAWLHDCGKIVTPEHVVDKATKLETVHDRINLVDARYEILRRDAELWWLRRRLEALENGTPPEAGLHQEYQTTLRSLADEQAFLRHVNQGVEYMPAEQQARVEAIAMRTWVDGKGEVQPLLTEDEVRNLNISKGTLNPEECEVVHNHVLATISMLERLPFPKHLKNVAEYAGGHHERMDGMGYAKGLTRDQMSVQARIMAIADIFEALTAKDRPYKVGKKLSESLRILSFMKREGHIDPDLFDIFVGQKVYEEYAAQYLTPEQIDEVDSASLLK